MKSHAREPTEVFEPGRKGNSRLAHLLRRSEVPQQRTKKSTCVETSAHINGWAENVKLPQAENDSVQQVCTPNQIK